MEILLTLAVFLLIVLIFTTSSASTRSEARLNEVRLTTERLEAQLAVVLNQLGIEPAQQHLAKVHQALSSGTKIEAVKAYREATGADLTSAVRAVDALDAARRR